MLFVSIMRNIKTDIFEKEKALLENGLSYREVSLITGTLHKTIEARNRFHYKIDIVKAFEDRIKKDGIPNNLCCDDSFGNWFVGLFDGEGNFQVSGAKSTTYLNLAVRIGLRIDDLCVIEKIYNVLGGTIYINKNYNGKRLPAVEWKIHSTKKLSEVILPLFKKYKLYTKKAMEFELFEKLVTYQYIRTLGGKCCNTQRPRNIEYISDIFQKLKSIRHPTENTIINFKNQANKLRSEIK